MKFEITFEHLVMLVAILYILMFIVKTKEGFDQTKQDKACSQESINYGHLSYMFNSPAVPRR
jgi:hypothetical protein